MRASPPFPTHRVIFSKQNFCAQQEKLIQREEGRPDGWFLDLPKKTAPIGRLLGPEDVAKHVLFWASEQSAPVTGQVYEVTQTAFLGHG